MNPDVKEEWLCALKSGQYQQTKDALWRKGEGYCCLGVLCDLAVKNNVPGLSWKAACCNGTCESTNRSIVQIDDAGTVDINQAMPVQAVYEWAGLQEEDVTILAEMNDAGAPFSAIEIYIGKHL